MIQGVGGSCASSGVCLGEATTDADLANIQAENFIEEVLEVCIAF